MCTTPRQSPVSTSTLTRVLKPSPKKAFVSPATHQGRSRRFGEAVVVVMSYLLQIAGRVAGQRGDGVEEGDGREPARSASRPARRGRAAGRSRRRRSSPGGACTGGGRRRG